MKNNISKYLLIFAALSAIYFLESCTPPKNVTYFQDVAEETLISAPVSPIKIEPNDKLLITVKTMDPTLSALFNLQIVGDRVGENEVLGGGRGTLNSTYSSGLSRYTVSPEGKIDFPILGEIYVKGMTRNELAGYIKGELVGRELAKDPIVTVEYVNMGVSILGEINSPGLYAINRDQTNILQALSMAGDLTLNGQRDNVTLLRESEEGLQSYKLDLTNLKELAQSPAFYLKQGDIIYVEPNNMRKRQTTTNGNNVTSVSFWVSIASLLTSLVTTIAVLGR